MGNKEYKEIEKVLKTRIEHGDSMHDIAMSFDVDKATVSRWARKFNIKTRNKFPGAKK